MCESTQSRSKVRRVIRENLQGYRQTQILSIHELKIENFFVVANSTILSDFYFDFYSCMINKEMQKKAQTKMGAIYVFPRIVTEWALYI